MMLFPFSVLPKWEVVVVVVPLLFENILVPPGSL